MLGALGRFFKTVPRSYTIAIFLASLLNISSAFTISWNVGADGWLYLVWMRCFNEQFWQGDLYPRWCLDANDGLGTSVFMFYFPLPFYFAALFQPLIVMGLSYSGLMVLLCFLTSFMAIMSCYAWLKDIVDARIALLSAILFVFLPYHLEAMLFRGVYTEIFGMVWLPLMFKYTRKIAMGQGNCIGVLALLTGISLLSQLSITAEALVLCGIYIMVMSGKGWEPKKHFALASLWGILLAVFYLAPADYYNRFIALYDRSDIALDWSIKFITLDLLSRPDLHRPFFGSLLTITLLVVFILMVFIRRLRIQDRFVRREACLWMVMGAMALFMLLPVSAPLYAHMGPFSKVLFPWRMQMMMTLAIIYLVAVWMQWQIQQPPKKTWKTDYDLTLFLFWLFSQYMTATFTPTGEALKQQITSSKIMWTYVDHTIWMEDGYWGCEYLLERTKKTKPQAAIASGEGNVEVRQWGWRAIDMEVDSKKPVTLRLNHSYFPVWKAKTGNDEMLTLRPEEKTGLMLVDVPSGKNRVVLTYSVFNASSHLMLSYGVSIAAWILILLSALSPLLRRKKIMP